MRRRASSRFGTSSSSAPCKPTEMGRWYDEADVYLNASDIDNMPNSIIESFACGLPVVTTRAGGIPYIVEHERNGLLVDCGDHAALAAAALRLLDEPALARRLIDEGLSDVKRLYTWEAVGDGWAALYRRLVGAEASAVTSSSDEAVHRAPTAADRRGEHSMRRGVVSVPDPRLRRRTVKTLPEELRVRGVQVLSSFRERIGLALSGGAPEVARSPRGVVSALRDDPTRARRRRRGGDSPKGSHPGCATCRRRSACSAAPRRTRRRTRVVAPTARSTVRSTCSATAT